ncbi:MAG: hypothetical protein U9N55_03425 [candidate division Zixibacteria bacterium]|nr:hypothetical protein [candidate division Zixibacteria bacterium]
MLYVVIDHARSHGASEVLARPLPTEKNRPCLEFFKKSDFALDSDKKTWRWLINQDYTLPDEITLVRG